MPIRVAAILFWSFDAAGKRVSVFRHNSVSQSKLQKKVLNPRLITKRKKILPSPYMRGFNHVAVCLPQLELVNGMLAEINELK